MEAIVAAYRDWGIGYGGTQTMVIPEDRKHFQKLTEGNAIIVGRRTMDDFPDGKPLKNRVNIVLTHQDIEIEGAIVVHSVEEALEEAKKYPKVFVVGGASVYKQFMNYFEKIHVTKIFDAPKSDAFFTNIDNAFDWTLEDESEIKEYNGVKYKFSVFEAYDINNYIK